MLWEFLYVRSALCLFFYFSAYCKVSKFLLIFCIRPPLMPLPSFFLCPPSFPGNHFYVSYEPLTAGVPSPFRTPHAYAPLPSVDISLRFRLISFPLYRPFSPFVIPPYFSLPSGVRVMRESMPVNSPLGTVAIFFFPWPHVFLPPFSGPGPYNLFGPVVPIPTICSRGLSPSVCFARMGPPVKFLVVSFRFPDLFLVSLTVFALLERLFSRRRSCASHCPNILWSFQRRPLFPFLAPFVGNPSCLISWKI